MTLFQITFADIKKSIEEYPLHFALMLFGVAGMIAIFVAPPPGRFEKTGASLRCSGTQFDIPVGRLKYAGCENGVCKVETIDDEAISGTNCLLVTVKEGENDDNASQN